MTTRKTASQSTCTSEINNKNGIGTQFKCGINKFSWNTNAPSLWIISLVVKFWIMSFKYSRGLRFGAQNVCFVESLLMLLQDTLYLFTKCPVHHPICQRMRPERTNVFYIPVLIIPMHLLFLEVHYVVFASVRISPFWTDIQLHRGLHKFPKNVGATSKF